MSLGSVSRPPTRPLRRTARQKQRESDELYEMANLFPRTTGLPMVVWVSPKGHARHGARVKVSLTPGKMDITQTAVVGIRPRPRLIEGQLATPELRLVLRWIQLNEAVLMEFWNEAIDSVELGGRLKKI
jgi:hypothetical protein